ncbi:MAG: glycosyltransferase family 4 protein [bacterium]
MAVSEYFLVNDENKQRSNGIFIGNLTPIKNPEFLIDTCMLLKQKKIPFTIIIVGEDRYCKQGKTFKDLVHAFGLDAYFHFLGFVPHRDIKPYLAQSLLYINTSHSEGQCLAVYEAALAGCHLCLPNILAFPSVFGTNALYHATPQILAHNIISVLNHPIHEHRVHNQQLILEKYTYANIKQGTKDLFINHL